MASPLAGGDAGRSASRRRRSSPQRQVSLIWQRVLRGARRQLAPFLILWFLVTGVLVLYEFADGVPIPAALPFSALIGVAAAFVIAAIFELSRNTITSVASLGERRGYVVLGAAPELSQQALRELPPDWRNPLGILAFRPASSFATAFRDLQGSIAKDGLVAFIGTIPNDGASTTALGAAVSAVQQGRRVLLVDCDLCRRSLTQMLAGEVSAGVFEAAGRPNDWRNMIIEEPETGLALLPAAPQRNPWATLVGTPGFQSLMKQLRAAYDLVILDCPPALGSVEGAVLARGCQRCVLVVSWDETSVGTLRHAMKTLSAGGRPSIYVNRVPAGYRFGRLRPD